MTASKLIEILSKIPPNADVSVEVGEFLDVCPVKQVRLTDGMYVLDSADYLNDPFWTRPELKDEVIK